MRSTLPTAKKDTSSESTPIVERAQHSTDAEAQTQTQTQRNAAQTHKTRMAENATPDQSRVLKAEYSRTLFLKKKTFADVRYKQFASLCLYAHLSLFLSRSLGR